MKKIYLSKPFNYNKYLKQQRKFRKQINKLKLTDVDLYNTLYGSCQWKIPLKHTYLNSYMIMMSNIKLMQKYRQQIVSTLIEINYHRGNEKWEPKVIIAFMTEALQYFKGEIFFDVQNNDITLIHFKERNKYYEDYLKRLCDRYNVPENRLKTQIALFLRNAKEGKDKANLYEYFSPYELIRWQYRDKEKLQLDLENNKLNDLEIQLIKDLYNI